MHVSDAQARAPQDVYRARAGGAVGDTERSQNERAAARRTEREAHAAEHPQGRAAHAAGTPAPASPPN
jgi:hypothetical protein